MANNAVTIENPVEQAYKNAPKTWIKRSVILLIVFSILLWSFLAIDFNGINPNGVKLFRLVLKFFVWPDSNPSKPVLLKYVLTIEKYGILYLMLETIFIAFIGTLLGAIISIPFAFISSKNITGSVVSYGGSFTITLIRTFPIFVWGMIFVKVEGGAVAGVLAIAVSSIGMISKLYIEAIEDIDKGIIEALDSTGANAFQKIRYGILPQLSASFLSTAIYRFEINIKNATILGMVGAGGIGFTLTQALGSFNWGIVSISLWGIIFVVFIVEYYSTKIRKKLATGE